MLHRLPMITMHPSHRLKTYAEVRCVSNVLHLWLRLPSLFSSRLANRSCTHCNCCHLVHTASCCYNTTATNLHVLVLGPHPNALLSWCQGHIQTPCCPGSRATSKRPADLVPRHAHMQMPCCPGARATSKRPAVKPLSDSPGFAHMHTVIVCR